MITWLATVNGRGKRVNVRDEFPDVYNGATFRPYTFNEIRFDIEPGLIFVIISRPDIDIGNHGNESIGRSDARREYDAYPRVFEETAERNETKRHPRPWSFYR